MNLEERMKEFNKSKRLGPFRRAILRGLGILLPPLLTIVLFFWVAHTVAVHVLNPMEDATRHFAVTYFADIRTPDDVERQPNASDAVVIDGQAHPLSSKGTITIGDQVYHRTEDGKFVPLHVYDTVRAGCRSRPDAHDGHGYLSLVREPPLAAGSVSRADSVMPVPARAVPAWASSWRPASGGFSGTNSSGLFIGCRS